MLSPIDSVVLPLRVDISPTILELIGHTGVVYSVCFSVGGEKIVSGSSDMSVKIWDALPMSS
eukprot:SAG31_NODE_628_length_13432_cov_131.456086_2_plen_62_part_00